MVNIMPWRQSNQEPAWAHAQRRLIWAGWGVLMVGVSLLFGVYLYSVRDQVREAAWAEGRAASRMLQWQLQAQMQHLDDVMLHTCESYERLGPTLTEKDALFKGRVGAPTPYEQLFILGPKGESMLSLPQSMSVWGQSEWLDQARQHGMGQIFTMVLPRDGRDLLARVLPVWSESGQFKGAVVGVLPVQGLETLVRETAQPYGLNLSVLQRSVAVLQSPQSPADLEDAAVYREQLRLPEHDLVLDVGLRQDAVLARWAMAWQWLVVIWILIALCLTWGARWLHKALTRQVQAAAQLKSEQEIARVRAGFLANMSHELRTPMMGVLGATELLEGVTGVEQSRYLKIIRNSGKHLLELLNNVLDFSRLDAGAMPLEPQEVAPLELLETVVQSFLPQAELKKLSLYAELDFPADLQVRLDGFRLSQIVSNIVGNAFKFTHQGCIRVQAGLTKELESTSLWVRVIDSGIGLTAEDQLRLFKPFSQADNSTSRQYGGSGLGLVIVQQLLQFMGGEIRLNSTRGLGTEVWISVPIDVLSSGRTLEPMPGFWHVAIEDAALRDVVLSHLTQIGVHFCTEPLVDSLSPVVRVVDTAKWLESVSANSLQDTDWLIVWDGRLAPELPVDLPDNVRVMHALQSREDWSKLVGHYKSNTHPIEALEDATAKRHPMPKILVAEDNETTRHILALYFAATNYEVDFASDGVVALELWRKRSYDMAILDCHMPGVDGFTVAEQIRAAESSENKKPLIALTAATMQEDIDRCKKAGMDDVWPKPISKIQLLNNIEKLALHIRVRQQIPIFPVLTHPISMN